MLPDGAIPIVPVHAGPKSDKMSPNKLDATTTVSYTHLTLPTNREV